MSLKQLSISTGGLGRPTYGRQENNKYFDICAARLYALIDALIDSPVQ